MSYRSESVKKRFNPCVIISLRGKCSYQVDLSLFVFMRLQAVFIIFSFVEHVRKIYSVFCSFFP